MASRGHGGACACTPFVRPRCRRACRARGGGHGGACACAPFVARACSHTSTRGRRRTCACLGMTAGGEAPGRPRPASNFPLSPPPSRAQPEATRPFARHRTSVRRYVSPAKRRRRGPVAGARGCPSPGVRQAADERDRRDTTTLITSAGAPPVAWRDAEPR